MVEMQLQLHVELVTSLERTVTAYPQRLLGLQGFRVRLLNVKVRP